MHDQVTSWETPTLEKYGTFRELTEAKKNIIGDDLIPGVGLDCSGTAPPGDPTACIRS